MKLPSCPECGIRVPFWSSQFRINKTLTCRSCGAKLEYPKSDVAMVNLQALTASWFIYHRLHNTEDQMVAIAVIIPLATIYIYFRLKPVVAENGSPKDT